MEAPEAMPWPSREALREVVAIVGTTGVGKSQLAVDLARFVQNRYTSSARISGSQPSSSTSSSRNLKYDDAVILSSDSMQLYDGLPLITNQVTPEEMQGVEHWGINVVRPGQGGSWEVGKWCQEALQRVRLRTSLVFHSHYTYKEYSVMSLSHSYSHPKVRSLRDFQLPIVCGGTHYYVQHFLFPPSALSVDRSGESSTASLSKSQHTKWTPPCTYAQLEANHALPAQPDQKMTEALGNFYLPEAAPTNNEGLLSLYRLLEWVDPAEAQRWHWRDGRKVRRAIERWWEAQADSIHNDDGAGTQDHAKDELAPPNDRESGAAR